MQRFVLDIYLPKFRQWGELNLSAVLTDFQDMAMLAA